MNNKYFIITYTSPKDNIFHNTSFSSQDFASVSKMWLGYAERAKLTTINIMEAKTNEYGIVPLCIPYGFS